MTNLETDMPTFDDAEITPANIAAKGDSQPTIELSAEFERYQSREKSLLEVIEYQTRNRKEAAVKIAKAREELRMVRRLLGATKPRKTKASTST